MAGTEHPEHQLRRTLGPVQLTFLGIGAIVGAGGAAMIGAACDRVFQAGWRDGPGLG